MARNSQDPTLRILALRTYVTKIAPRRGDPRTRLGMHLEAWKLAERVEEKRLVLSGLARVPLISGAAGK